MHFLLLCHSGNHADHTDGQSNLFQSEQWPPPLLQGIINSWQPQSHINLSAKPSSAELIIILLDEAPVREALIGRPGDSPQWNTTSQHLEVMPEKAPRSCKQPLSSLWVCVIVLCTSEWWPLGKLCASSCHTLICCDNENFIVAAGFIFNLHFWMVFLFFLLPLNIGNGWSDGYINGFLIDRLVL